MVVERPEKSTPKKILLSRIKENKLEWFINLTLKYQSNTSFN